MFSSKLFYSHTGLLNFVPGKGKNLVIGKRTFFDLFKFLSKPKVKINPDELPYSVVMPATVSPRRHVPDDIQKPEYAESGIPGMPSIYPILADSLDVERMKAAGALARKVLDLAGKEVKEGVTTDHIDEVVHQACIDHKAYPSPLNYKRFPKSVCTSVNNVMVHGIPDSRPLRNGDIINIDVTVCLNEYHGDVSETFLVGDVDERGRQLVETARRCRDEAIMVCSHEKLISDIGNTITKCAVEAGFAVCPTFVGHGIGKLFHCKPDIWHYANRYAERMVEGMIFTIEPVILEYPDIPIEDDDGWTVYSQNYARSAQFEHTVLITHRGVDVLTAGSDEEFSQLRETDHKDPESSLEDETAEWKFKT